MTVCPHCGKPIPPTGGICPHCGKPVAGSALLANPKQDRTLWSTIIILFLAMGFGVLGLLLSSQASAGASMVAFACLLGIIARIVQAAVYENRH